VILPAGGDGRLVEGIDRSARFDGERDVDFAHQTALAADPEVRFVPDAEAGRRRIAFRLLLEEGVAERRKRLLVKALRPGVVGDWKANMIDHRHASWALTSLQTD